mmetsp:Transcript_55043/g.103146  ORF Transcript_55043/g.103146 Transcript_55043/m.103146 type:complete len:261 (+) Transcript_55043:429-1211(+)
MLQGGLDNMLGILMAHEVQQHLEILRQLVQDEGSLLFAALGDDVPDDAASSLMPRCADDRSSKLIHDELAHGHRQVVDDLQEDEVSALAGAHLPHIATKLFKDTITDRPVATRQGSLQLPGAHRIHGISHDLSLEQANMRDGTEKAARLGLLRLRLSATEAPLLRSRQRTAVLGSFLVNAGSLGRGSRRIGALRRLGAAWGRLALRFHADHRPCGRIWGREGRGRTRWCHGHESHGWGHGHGSHSRGHGCVAHGSGQSHG